MGSVSTEYKNVTTHYLQARCGLDMVARVELDPTHGVSGWELDLTMEFTGRAFGGEWDETRSSQCGS